MLVSTEVDASTGLPMGNIFISTTPPETAPEAAEMKFFQSFF